MIKKKEVANIATSTIVAAVLGAVGAKLLITPTPALGNDYVKCAGVIKKGMNDCGTPEHACSALSKADNVSDEWIFIPENICKKITNAKIVK